MAKKAKQGKGFDLEELRSEELVAVEIEGLTYPVTGEEAYELLKGAQEA